jgi:heat shock protein HslJ
MAGVNQAANKEWILTSLNGESITAAKPPTLKFSNGRLAVFGGVNRLNASYALVGDSVTVGDIVSTKMAGDPALMEQESNFAKALRSANKFEVHGNELQLLRDGTVVAAFRSDK